MFKEEEKDRAKKWMDLGTIDHNPLTPRWVAKPSREISTSHLTLNGPRVPIWISMTVSIVAMMLLHCLVDAVSSKD